MLGNSVLRLLVLVYAPAVLAAIAWNVAACILMFRARRAHTRPWRYASYVSGALMLPAFIADVGRMDPKTAAFTWVAWLYPACFALAAAANLRWFALGRARWWQVPIPLLNALLAVVYLARYASYLGLQLGALLGGLLVSYAMVQSACTTFLYVFVPIFNWLPALLIPVDRSSTRVRALNVAPPVACGVLLVAVLALLPRGFTIAASWQADPLMTVPRDRRDFRPGVVFRVPRDPPPTQESLSDELALIGELGARAVNLFVHDDLMSHPERAAAVGDFVTSLRRDGVTIIITADYPGSWALRPPISLDASLAAMAPFHEFLATRYRPDILVPVIEPYGAYVALTTMRHTPAAWQAALSGAVEVIHRRAPGVRCAAYLGQSDDDRELYRLLCGVEGGVDVVGFSFYAVYQTRAETSDALARVAGWVDAYGDTREHWVFEYGQSPVTMGGERAQSGFVRLVASWAAAQSPFHGVCVFALGDHDEKLGLVSATGKRRRAFTNYQALARRLRGDDAPLPEGGPSGP